MHAKSVIITFYREVAQAPGASAAPASPAEKATLATLPRELRQHIERNGLLWDLRGLAGPGPKPGEWFGHDNGWTAAGGLPASRDPRAVFICPNGEVHAAPRAHCSPKTDVLDLPGVELYAPATDVTVGPELNAALFLPLAKGLIEQGLRFVVTLRDEKAPERPLYRVVYGMRYTSERLDRPGALRLVGNNPGEFGPDDNAFARVRGELLYRPISTATDVDARLNDGKLPFDIVLGMRDRAGDAVIDSGAFLGKPVPIAIGRPSPAQPTRAQPAPTFLGRDEVKRLIENSR
jgi:hypothetical protein